MNLAGKKVMITGASRGMGLAFAKECHRRGAHVMLAMRNPNSELLNEFETDPSRVNLEKLEMGSFEGIETFLNLDTVKNYHPDILINNAGQLTGGLLEKQPVDKIYAMFQVNLVGLTHLTRALLPEMLARGSGKIVNNASISGEMFLPCASTYAAAKAGVVALSESLMGELHGTGVSVYCLITPGIKTRMFDEITPLYGDHMDTSDFDSMSVETYSELVCDGIEADDLYFRPGGKLGIMLKLARWTPSLFRSLGRSRFKR